MLRDNETEDAIRLVIANLEAVGLEYAISGSFASSTWGSYRQTNDLDLVISMRAVDAPKFLDQFTDEFTVATDALNEALEMRHGVRSFHMMHYETAFQVDLFLLNDEPYPQEQFRRRIKRELLPGMHASVFSREDIVLQKLLWYKQGNERSESQWNDCVRVLEVNRDTIDNEHLNHWAETLEVKSLLDELRSETVEVDDIEQG